MSTFIINPTYIKLDIFRMLRNTGTIIFTLGFPVGFYLIFGPIQSYGSTPVPHGNVSGVIMVTMALYGTITAVVSLSANTAIEQAKGWGRQLELTPMTSQSYLLNKMISVQLTALAPVICTFGVGALTGAKLDGLVWLWAALLVWGCATIFIWYGLFLGLLFRNEAAISVGAGTVVAMAFLGNMFVPLSGIMLKVSVFTPFYGVNGLVRLPVVGSKVVPDLVGIEQAPIWHYLVNSGCWLAVFVLLALWVSTRTQER